MTSIILAGGKASRMDACNKAFIKINDKPIIEKQVEVLKSLSNEIIIVSNSPNKYEDLQEVRVLPDIIPNCGPLGGIYSGLSASKDNYNFVVACDMPFLDSGFIKYLKKKPAVMM